MADGEHSEISQDDWRELRVSISTLEARLNIKGFFARLSKENDWAYIVHLQALIETATNDLLRAHFREPRLENFFRDLTFNGGAASKVALMRCMDLMSKEALGIITMVCSIRNRLVHHAPNVNVSLKDYVAGLSSNQLEEIRKPLRYYIKDEYVEVDDLRSSIWLASFFVIAELSVQIDCCLLRDRAENAEQKAASLYRDLYEAMKKAKEPPTIEELFKLRD